MTTIIPGEFAARKNQEYSNSFFNKNVKGTDQFICMGVLGYVIPADECWIKEEVPEKEAPVADLQEDSNGMEVISEDESN